MEHGRVRISVAGWSHDQRDALAFLAEDTAIALAWVDADTIEIDARDERRIRGVIAFLTAPAPVINERDLPPVVDPPAHWERGAVARNWVAHPGLRFAGYLVDAFVLGVCSFVTWALFGPDTYVVVAWLTSAAYRIGLIGLRGRTLGNAAVHTRVARLSDGEVPGVGIAAARWLVLEGAALLGVVLDLPALLFLIWEVAVIAPVFFTPLRQGLHDRVAGVVVVDDRVAALRRAARPSINLPPHPG